jgi:hypothetical protein
LEGPSPLPSSGRWRWLKLMRMRRKWRCKASSPDERSEIREIPPECSFGYGWRVRYPERGSRRAAAECSDR